MKNNNYLVIQGWMINELKLSGNELLTYALIYGFSQDNCSVYSGTQGYIAETLNISKRAVVDILKKLIEKQLIIKIDKEINNIKLCDYKVNLTSLPMQFLHRGYEETSQGGSEETSHHIYNKDIYKDNNNNNSNQFENQNDIFITYDYCEKLYNENNFTFDLKEFWLYYKEKALFKKDCSVKMYQWQKRQDDKKEKELQEQKQNEIKEQKEIQQDYLVEYDYETNKIIRYKYEKIDGKLYKKIIGENNE